MDFSLELAHLQLTLRCNLRCPFCGQWGAHGFAKDAAKTEMSVEEWLRAIASIVELGPKTNFLLWGGEPLLYEGIPAVLDGIRSHSREAAIVTNGTLLERNASMLAERVSKIYISLDGPGAVHDRIRNSEGLHQRIERGLAALPREGLERTALCVITEGNCSLLAETAHYAGRIGFDKIVFQNLIFLLPEESARYCAWLKDSLGIESGHASSWTYDAIPPFASKLPEIYTAMERRIAKGEFPLKVEFHPQGLGASNIMERMAGRLSLPDSPPHCLAPFKHINVAPDGSLRFCVDYNEVELGSLRTSPLQDLLKSPRAEKFREGVSQGLNPACARCPWRHKTNYGES